MAVFPSLFHILFSNLGYNPTDDGFTLAYSRRILDGQIPHMDFIIIRPFLSPLLHIPIVLVGGEYTFYLSRFFVWIQFGLISILLIRFITIYTTLLLDGKTKFFVYLTTFILAAHNFPIMAWHTIDGLMMSLIGLNIFLTKLKLKSIFSFVFLGLAYLCKQSFLPIGLLLLFLNGNWKKIGNWISFFFPFFLYILFLRLIGPQALEEAISQMLSQKDILSVITFHITSTWLYLGILLGVIVYFTVKNIRTEINYISIFILIILFALIFWGLFKGIVNEISLLFFGIVISLLILDILLQNFPNFLTLQSYLIVCLLGVFISISLGYPYPIFIAGGCLLLIGNFFSRNGCLIKISKRTVLILTIFLLAAFLYSRYNYIYREESANKIKYDLSGILPGASLIETNINTYNVLVELNMITNKFINEKREFAIIPDNAGYWVKSIAQNPLSIDWIYETELNKIFLTNRIINDINNKKGSIFIIMQKYNAEFIAQEFYSISYSNPVIKYVRQNFDLIDETKYYYIYK